MKFDKKNFSLDLAQDTSTALLHKKMFKCLLFILFPPVPCNAKEFNPDLDVIFQNFLQLFLHRPYKKCNISILCILSRDYLLDCSIIIN